MMPALVVGRPPCDNLSPQEGVLGYQVRGDRCEGMFVQDIRSNLRLKSLMAPSGATSSPGENMLSAVLPSSAPKMQYHLRINSLDPRVHYQLDTLIPDGGVFRWPVGDVVGRVPLDASELVPLSWTTSEPVFYVPVSFPSAAPFAPGIEPKTAIVIIESTVPIQQYVARLKSEVTGVRTDLTAHTVLPTTRLEFALPERDSPGHYTLWLRVRLLGESQPEGQSWALWLP